MALIWGCIRLHTILQRTSVMIFSELDLRWLLMCGFRDPNHPTIIVIAQEMRRRFARAWEGDEQQEVLGQVSG